MHLKGIQAYLETYCSVAILSLEPALQLQLHCCLLLVCGPCEWRGCIQAMPCSMQLAPHSCQLPVASFFNSCHGCLILPHLIQSKYISIDK